MGSYCSDEDFVHRTPSFDQIWRREGRLERLADGAFLQIGRLLLHALSLSRPVRSRAFGFGDFGIWKLQLWQRQPLRAPDVSPEQALLSALAVTWRNERSLFFVLTLDDYWKRYPITLKNAEI